MVYLIIKPAHNNYSYILKLNNIMKDEYELKN